MYICYIDESGTSSIPGNTSHFVLAGLSIPISNWKLCEKHITTLKRKYSLDSAEIHTGWIIRNYTEQNKIVDFNTLNYQQRRFEVNKLRKLEILRLQKSPSHQKLLKQVKKNYKHTDPYIHLSFDERKQFVMDLVKQIGSWSFARLFAECIDKVHFDPVRCKKSIDEQAFEQIISRFEQYLKIIDTQTETKNFGLIVHDNNETVAKRHTDLMKLFHTKGTLFTSITNIIETPFFVNSALTSMIQVADICAFAIRRYLENNEDCLFKEIFKRADRNKNKTVVGVRHFTSTECKCLICSSHRAT